MCQSVTEEPFFFERCAVVSCPQRLKGERVQVFFLRIKSWALVGDQNMRYVAAYLLAVLGGNNNPSKKDITKILGSVGLDIDDDRLDKVRDEL